jgi:hypothetical protein
MTEQPSMVLRVATSIPHGRDSGSWAPGSLKSLGTCNPRPASPDPNVCRAGGGLSSRTMSWIEAPQLSQ